MKESDALKKWCPHKRLIYFIENEGTVGPLNCIGFSSEDKSTIKAVENTQKSNLFKCIASDCMNGCDKDGNWLGRCGLTKC